MAFSLFSALMESRKNNSSPVIMATGFCRSCSMLMFVFILFLFVVNAVCETQIASLELISLAKILQEYQRIGRFKFSLN